MLGLVVAGNIAMTFVFWELVGNLLLFPDRFLHRAAECIDGGQQGFYRQPRRRLWHDHRADGAVGQPGDFFVRRYRWPAGHFFARSDPAVSSITLDRTGRDGPYRCSRVALAASDGRDTGLDQDLRDPARVGTPGGYGYWLLCRGWRRHFLWLRWQECAIPAARLVTGRHGRPHTGFGSGALGHDGRGGRLSGGQVLSGLYAGCVAGDRGDRG